MTENKQLENKTIGWGFFCGAFVHLWVGGVGLFNILSDRGIYDRMSIILWLIGFHVSVFGIVSFLMRKADVAIGFRKGYMLAMVVGVLFTSACNQFMIPAFRH